MKKKGKSKEKNLPTSDIERLSFDNPSKMVTKRDPNLDSHDHDDHFTFVNIEDGEKKKNHGYIREGMKLMSSMYKQWSEKDALIAVMG